MRTTDFRAALQLWYSKQLEESVLNHIIYRLDEFDIGGVNVTALDDFAGTKSLRLLIAAYAHQASNPVPILVSTPSTVDNSLTLPLLVWIDDNPDNNAFQIQTATNLGIEVITLFSTGEAKIWIDMHFGNNRWTVQYLTPEFLLKHDTSKSIRFITDNHRIEPVNEAVILNPNAGEDMLRYIRGRRLNQIPVLVYALGSILSTTYVTKFKFAGSTSSINIAIKYIRALAEGRDDDREWVGAMSC